MSDLSRVAGLDGIRLYLRRKKTLTELKALADTLISTDPSEFETVLTNVGFGSSNASGLARQIDRFQVLHIVEELIAEMTAAGVTSWTDAQSGAAATPVVQRADYGRSWAGN